MNWIWWCLSLKLKVTQILNSLLWSTHVIHTFKDILSLTGGNHPLNSNWEKHTSQHYFGQISEITLERCWLVFTKSSTPCHTNSTLWAIIICNYCHALFLSCKSLIIQQSLCPHQENHMLELRDFLGQVPCGFAQKHHNGSHDMDSNSHQSPQNLQ